METDSAQMHGLTPLACALGSNSLAHFLSFPADWQWEPSNFLHLSLYIFMKSCAIARMDAIPWHLQQRKERLKDEVLANLDFLIGSVTTQGARGGFNLTTAEQGKTRTRYIRQGELEEVRAGIERHRKLKEVLKELAEVNWEILKAKPR